MSVLSQFFTGGRFITDPTIFPRFTRPPAGVNRPANTINQAAFWTGGTSAIDRIPGSVDDNTNWTADTYKTVANLTSKAGLVAYFLGPELATTGDTCTMRITVDGGSPSVIVITAQENTTRAILGIAPPVNLLSTATTATLYDGVSSDGLTGFVLATSVMILSPTDLLFMGTPLLRFTSSLLVEMKASTNITGTASQERRSGVVLQRTA